MSRQGGGKADTILSLLRQFLLFLGDLYRSREIIFELAKRDFVSRYLGSYLGLLWAFVQPLVTVLIFWFVFQVGYKTPPVGNAPFVLWMMSGMIPWFFFADALSGATNSIIEYSFMVKKVVFRASVLPIVKILSVLLIHIIFIAIVLVIFLIYGFPFTLYQIQIFYYLFAMVVLNLGLSWITSSLMVFLKDIGQVINVVVQFGFWLTPIVWPIARVPEKYRDIVKLNPLYYLVEGYRDSFIHHRWFWEHMSLTVYFWILALFFFVVGAMLFNKLRQHFADVL